MAIRIAVRRPPGILLPPRIRLPQSAEFFSVAQIYWMDYRKVGTMSALMFTVIMLCITYVLAGATSLLLAAIAPHGVRKPKCRDIRQTA